MIAAAVGLETAIEVWER